MIIHVENVSYRYPRQHAALSDCSITCASGEIAALLGPNGSGKTTLLELLSRQRRWQGGHVRVTGGPDYRDLTIGWASSEPVFYESTGLRTFVEKTYGPAFGLTVRESRERADALAEQLLLKGDYSRPPRELSRGNRTKASLLLALLLDPHVLLLDEPFTGLDVGTLDAFLELIDSRARECGTCILLADHQVGTLESVVDRVSFIRSGSICATATRMQLVEQHGDLVTAYRATFAG
ncbi:MAG TPA: ABC transporter ATP-binding protein [Candidatus Krumholzibacteria bacterium]|nr:ABC transporter ATP-binding protein [Candidatus Krumholzibacteria bacterium]